MDTHVKVLGVLYIALSALLLIGALVVMIAIGGAAGAVGVSADPEDAALALPIIGIAGTGLIIFLGALALPGMVAGIGLLYRQPWARIVTIVLSAINLINLPFGTVLGAYGLWVLLHKKTEPLFSPASSTASL